MKRDAFVARVAQTIRRRALLKGGESIVVAVSGGADSMALLHALHALTASLDLSLHIAHLDHRVRPTSGEDAAFVAHAARELSLPCTIGSAPGDPRPSGRSPEEWLRERRLRFLNDVAVTTGATKIATGHTLDDQAETVLMRMLHGAGARGLGGIPPVNGLFVRPLIDIRRAETHAFCGSLGIQARVDETNSDRAYLRNAIRLDVLPVLAERVNARVAEALARAADTLRDDDALLDELARDAIEIETRTGGVGLDIETLRSLHPALRRRAVRFALGRGGTLGDVDAVLRLAAEGKPGDAIDLARGLNARVEYGSLVVGRTPSPAPEPSTIPLTVPGRTELAPWDAVVDVWVTDDAPAGWPDGRTTAVFDATTMRDVRVRSRRSGDRMRPLGADGSRSIADILGEAKLTRSERDRVPVVVSGDEIAWLVGHRVAEPSKVTARTERFLWMRFSEGGSEWS